MRDIKFRAWTGTEMVILENSGLQHYDFEGSYSLGFTVDKYSYFWAHEQYETATKRCSGYPIMQCTGLTDKNGDWIYEGDIVKCSGKQRTIKWSNGKFWFVAEIANSYEDISEMFGKYYNEVEVIGNIYQNPELI